MSLRRILLKIGITACLLLVFALHVAKIAVLDVNAMIILAFLLLVWIFPLIEELQISEYLKIKLKTAENQLALSEIETIQRLSAKGVTFLVPEWEFELLKKIAQDPKFLKNTNEGMELFYKDLHHLISAS